MVSSASSGAEVVVARSLELYDKLLNHVINILFPSSREAARADKCYLFLVIFRAEETSGALRDTRPFWPDDAELVSGLIVSCDANDAILHLAGFVHPLCRLISWDLVESPVGPLDHKVPSMNSACTSALLSRGFPCQPDRRDPI